MRELSATDPSEPPRLEPVRAPPALAAGATLGRYRVIERLGAGGMGEVYRARDEELGRDVAIKVLRTEIAGAARTKGRARLLREAQAMAQLAHPNVVTVFEASTFGEQVCVVMELVSGRTLRAELAGAGRPWRAIVARYVAAGRGLAAAHRASIVHRDFKPDNVLVADDGRVRVTDFGLAGIGAGAPPDGDDDPRNAETPERMAELETADAACFSVLIAGTPAYMAPEQHEGHSTDARCDQFAFCVSLYEALYGERPFSGNDYRSLRAAVLAGRVRDEPAGATVPARIRALLLRGLATEPEARFPTMEPLLAALEDDPAARRRRRLAWVGLPLLAAAIAVAATLATRRGAAPVSCAGAAARLTGRWDEAARGRLAAAFAQSGQTFGPELGAQVSASLDRYAAAWTAMRTDACEATHLRHEQSEALLDLRVACLDRRADQLGALAAVLAGATGAAIGAAPDAVAALAPLADCADAALLTAVVAPADPAQRPSIAVARLLIDRADALGRGGAYPSGLAIARVASAMARQFGYPPLLGEALYSEGKLLDELGNAAAARAAYEGAAEAASAGHDDLTAAAALNLLVSVVAVDQARLDEASALLPVLRAAIGRLGDHPSAELAILTTQSSVLAELGRRDEALAMDKRALALGERIHGPAAPEMAQLHHNLATSYFAANDFEAAAAEAERGLAVARAALGDHHPLVATLWSGISVIECQRDNPRRALEASDQALAIREGVFGRDSRKVADTLINRANALDLLGRYDEAQADLRRALAIEEHELGPTHPNVGQALAALAGSLAMNRHREEAIPLYERSLAIFDAHYGADSLQSAYGHAELSHTLAQVGRLDEAERHGRAALAALEKHHGVDDPEVVPAIYSLAEIRFARGDTAGAVADLERAAGIVERGLGPQHLNLASLLKTIGEMRLERGEPALAIAPLERALAIYEPNQANTEAFRVAGTRFALGQALWAAGRDRARAVALARAALSGFAGEDYPEDRAEVERWLAKHAG